MKKKLVMLLTALMLVGATTTAFAAPSAEVDSPEINSPGAGDDFEEVTGNIAEFDNMSDAELEAVAEMLCPATSDVTAEGGTVKDVKEVTVQNLKDVVKEAEDYATAIILAAFDITVEAEEGASVTITVKANADVAKKYVAFHEKANNDWEVVPVTVNEDGSVTFTLTSFSPVIIAEVTEKSDKTGDLVVLPMIALAGLAGAAVCGKKSK